jgi:hypothetical protein
MIHRADSNPPPPDDSDYVPNFELHRDVIREDNWADYEAKGFTEFFPYRCENDLSFARTVCGIEHVYTGDAYDYDAGRPLRHKPGRSIYTDPEGRTNSSRTMRKWDERDFERRLQGFRARQDEGGPGRS